MSTRKKREEEYSGLNLDEFEALSDVEVLDNMMMSMKYGRAYSLRS